MDKQRFWALIDQAREASDGTCDSLVASLKACLRSLPLEEVGSFAQWEWEYRYAINRKDLWAAAETIRGGCGDDNFEYFRCWLIGQGERVLVSAVADPDSLADLPFEEDPTCEELGGAAREVYQELTGRQPASGRARIDESWPPDRLPDHHWTDSDRARLLPRLFARFEGGPRPWDALPPALLAVRASDPRALDAALAASPPFAVLDRAAADISFRFARLDEQRKLVALGMLERLLTTGGQELATRVLYAHLSAIRGVLEPEALVRISTRQGAALAREGIDTFGNPQDRRTVDKIFEHGGRVSSPEAVAAAVATAQLDIVERALTAKVDVAECGGRYRGLLDRPVASDTWESRWINGSLLHLAVCTGSPTIVEMLVARGMDTEAKDEAGYTPRALAKMLWLLKPNEANRMVQLFDAKQRTAPVSLPPTPGFSKGARVKHKKFGSGVIETVIDMGRQEGESKVTVRFGSETKTLQTTFLELDVSERA